MRNFTEQNSVVFNSEFWPFYKKDDNEISFSFNKLFTDTRHFYVQHKNSRKYTGTHTSDSLVEGEN